MNLLSHDQVEALKHWQRFTMFDVTHPSCWMPEGLLETFRTIANICRPLNTSLWAGTSKHLVHWYKHNYGNLFEDANMIVQIACYWFESYHILPFQKFCIIHTWLPYAIFTVRKFSGHLSYSSKKENRETEIWDFFCVLTVWLGPTFVIAVLCAALYHTGLW